MLKQAQAELLKGYLAEGEPDQIVHERLARAKLFHVLILVKIVVRRVPIYQERVGSNDSPDDRPGRSGAS